MMIIATNISAQILWSSGAGSAWLTGGNWTGGAVPTGAQIAQFGANPTAATGVGINGNSAAVNFNTGIQGSEDVGAIEVSSSRAAAFLVGNSSTSAGKNVILTLFGVTVNSVANVVLRNNSAQLFTLQNTQNTGTQLTSFALGNSTENIINIDGTGGITISSVISGTSKKLTKDGVGTGALVLSGANTYTGLTTVNSGLLQFNRTGGGTLPSTNNVFINGGTLQISTNQTINILTLSAGGTLTVDPGVTLTINGAFAHNGGIITSSGTIAYGPSGALSYGATTPQTTTSIEFPSAAAPLAVEINNLTNVTLHASRTIAGPLAFNNGKLILGANNFECSMTVLPSSSKYVVTDGTGSLIIAVASLPVIFPVGPSTTLYHPATLVNNGVPNIFSVKVSSTTPLCADPIKSVNATWDMSVPSAPPPLVNCDITLDYTGATTGLSYAPAAARIIHCNGATADYSNGTVSGTVATGTGFTSFSPFGISSDPIALPVSILSFAGQQERAVNVLRWSTANEFNNTGFEILRSTDGVNYIVIGFVNSLAVNGNSSDVLNYSFTDVAVSGTKQYYRLRQIDFDNRSNLSTIVFIKGERPLITSIDGVFPNPASGAVNVLIAASEREKVTLVVSDISGRVVSSKVVSVEQGSNTIPMDINQLNNGSYLIRLVCENGCNSAAKFMKL